MKTLIFYTKKLTRKEITFYQEILKKKSFLLARNCVEIPNVDSGIIKSY